VTRRARGQAATRAEALDAMAARKAELAKQPEQMAAPVLTLDAYADSWLTSIASSVEPRTVESYKGMLKKHIRPTLGTLPLAEITRGQVKDLLATKRSEGLSKNAVRLVRATLSGLYADAIDAELVTANPAARTGRARGRKTPDAVSAAERRGKVRAMTVEQLAAFLKAAKTGRHATLFLLLADTGMRPGEAFALTWKDIDLAPRVINVERAVARGGRLKGTKTDSARGGPDAAPGPLDAWQTRLEAETRAGVPRFRLYELRHTYPSHLLALGAPITYCRG
jgi:integrase